MEGRSRQPLDVAVGGRRAGATLFFDVTPHDPLTYAATASTIAGESGFIGPDTLPALSTKNEMGYRMVRICRRTAWRIATRSLSLSSRTWPRVCGPALSWARV